MNDAPSGSGACGADLGLRPKGCVGRVTALLACVGALAAFASGCDTEPRQEGVYYEILGPEGIPLERAHALRLTVWRFGNDVGGRVDFFTIDGIVNTRLQPYFEPTACRYFGSTRLVDRDFRIRVLGFDDAPLTMQAAWEVDNRDIIRGVLVEDGGLLEEGVELGPEGLAFRFEVDESDVLIVGLCEDVVPERSSSAAADTAEPRP